MPPLGVVRDGVSGRQHSSHGVVEVIVSSEIPDVRNALSRLIHTQEHINGHLFVSICTSK